MKKKFHVHGLSHKAFHKTVVWSVVASSTIVVVAAVLGRTAHNFSAALTDKPDIAIYLLLPEEDITTTTLLRDTETEKDYLAQTKNGPKLVKLKKGDEEWFVSFIEPLHEGSGDQTAEPATETEASL